MVLFLLVGLVGTGCQGVGQEVESIEPGKWKEDEGVLVVRFITSRAEADDLEHAERDPDIHYQVSVGSSKSMLLKAFAQEGNISVDAEDGPALVVRKLEAGDYFFNEIQASGGSAPLAVKFTVQPGRLTYIGDLEVLFIASKGFLGLGEDLSCALKVSTDSAAVLSSLKSRYSAVPALDTLPMVIEKPSL